MKFVKSWEEYKENWADLGRSFSVSLVAILVVVGLIIIAVPCSLLGIAPSEEDV